jgi:hypothetical protein
MVIAEIINKKLTTVFSGPRFSTKQFEEVAENIYANTLIY